MARLCLVVDDSRVVRKVARRILEIAAKGTPPGTILREIIPMSAADAGVPDGSPDGIILMGGGDAS